MNKFNRFDNKDGFTVIELLMAIVILGVVMAAITTMIVQSFNVFDSSTRRMSAGQLAELALSEVGSHLRSTTEVLNNSFDDINYSSSPWNFKGYHRDTESEIEFNLELNNEQLLLSVINGADVNNRVVANNVQDFYIKKDIDSNNEFEIYIKVKDGEENIAEKRINITSRNL